jgi:hypothetical protein
LPDGRTLVTLKDAGKYIAKLPKTEHEAQAMEALILVATSGGPTMFARISERADGSQRAGSIQWAASGQHLEFTIATKPLPKSTQVSLWFELLLNSVLSAEARYGTLVHELAHLYCGHLGTPNGRWWPDRQNLSLAVREFEAESGRHWWRHR